eukprot:UN30532
MAVNLMSFFGIDDIPNQNISIPDHYYNVLPIFSERENQSPKPIEKRKRINDDVIIPKRRKIAKEEPRDFTHDISGSIKIPMIFPSSLALLHQEQKNMLNNQLHHHQPPPIIKHHQQQ